MTDTETQRNIAEEDLRALVDAAPDGFLVTDPAGDILFVNRTAEELFAYDRGKLNGVNVDKLVPPRLRGSHPGHRSSYHSSPRLRPMGFGLDLVGLRQDGTEFPVEISLSPMSVHGAQLVTAVIRDVTDRRRLERERNQLSIELETERERDRIAMDLHDGIMQDIYASSLTLELALADANSRPEESQQSVDRAINQLHDVVRNIRSYIFDLRPRNFSGNLSEALQNLVDEFQQNSQIATETQVASNSNIEPDVAVAMYHIAHETLSNIQRHAHATLVQVSLSFGDRSGVLEVKDNGVGFDASAGIAEHHRGLRNMAARARLVGATLQIEGSKGQGTQTRVEFPLKGNFS